jgi:gluconolactonase
MFADPKKELPFSGVYRVRGGGVSLVTPELAGPNGIALSPDERHLYVGNWDPDSKVVMRYTLGRGGSVTGGEVFFDMTGAEGEDAVDGLKVDVVGNVCAAHPASGCSRPAASIWAPCGFRRARTTSPGETRTPARSTSRP